MASVCEDGSLGCVEDQGPTGLYGWQNLLLVTEGEEHRRLELQFVYSDCVLLLLAYPPPLPRR
jgi:hypothetical protein